MKPYFSENDGKNVYEGIEGMTPAEFARIVTNYLKSFDKKYIPSKHVLSEIFQKVKKKNQRFSRSIVIKATEEYFQSNLNLW